MIRLHSSTALSLLLAALIGCSPAPSEPEPEPVDALQLPPSGALVGPAADEEALGGGRASSLVEAQPQAQAQPEARGRGRTPTPMEEIEVVEVSPAPVTTPSEGGDSDSPFDPDAFNDASGVGGGAGGRFGKPAGEVWVLPAVYLSGKDRQALTRFINASNVGNVGPGSNPSTPPVVDDVKPTTKGT